MASRRMFRTDFIMSDQFLEMEAQTQLLYFYMIGNADDDGFVDNLSSLLRLTGLDRNHLERLIQVGYVLSLNEKLYLIVHWHQHNKVPQGRRVSSKHADALSKLDVVDEVYKVKNI